MTPIHPIERLTLAADNGFEGMSYADLEALCAPSAKAIEEANAAFIKLLERKASIWRHMADLERELETGHE